MYPITGIRGCCPGAAPVQRANVVAAVPRPAMNSRRRIPDALVQRSLSLFRSHGNRVVVQAPNVRIWPISELPHCNRNGRSDDGHGRRCAVRRSNETSNGRRAVGGIDPWPGARLSPSSASAGHRLAHARQKAAPPCYRALARRTPRSFRAAGAAR